MSFLKDLVKKFAVRSSTFEKRTDGSGESKTNNYTFYTREYQCGLIFNAVARIADEIIKMSPQHIIKKDGNSLVIELIENPDILQEMSKIKRDNQVVVGFCAESQNLLEFAKQKIAKKGCDYICANDISKKDIGFSSNDNELYIINKELDVYHIEKTDKQTAALKILENIYGKCK